MRHHGGGYPAQLRCVAGRLFEAIESDMSCAMLTSDLSGTLLARVQERQHPNPPVSPSRLKRQGGSRFSSSFYDRRGGGVHAPKISLPSSATANTTSADVTPFAPMPQTLQRQADGGLKVHQ